MPFGCLEVFLSVDMNTLKKNVVCWSSPVVERGLTTWAPGHWGSVAAACGVLGRDHRLISHGEPS